MLSAIQKQKELRTRLETVILFPRYPRIPAFGKPKIEQAEA
jgi:hypothetical protein